MPKLVHVVMFLVAVCGTNSVNHDWDMAVAIEDKVEFLDENATLVGITYTSFKNLKAITFDDFRRQIIVSDMIEENDTIYKVKLSDTKNPVPIIQNIPDDVVDLAVDPIEDVLYWIDSLNKKIMRVSLGDPQAKSEELFHFKDEVPQGIAIDSCRRKLYWTNANHAAATIERSNLNGTDREVIIRGNLFMPSGITIDHGARMIYWADMGEGIYFRIEAAKLDGTNRRIIYQDTHQIPFGIAVSDNAIFWTDLNNYALWSMRKDETGLRPEIVRRFNEKPMGLITKNNDYKNIPECQEVLGAIEAFHSSSGEMIVPANNSDYCLNYGEFTPYGCKCSRGFTGPRCEINLCHNLCINGNCYQSSQGYPKCKCPLGFTGERCEYEICNDFCLNGGSCSMTLNNATWPVCKCQEGYSGSRCERLDDILKLCSCDDGVVVFPANGEKPYCRCSSPLSQPETLSQPSPNQDSDFTTRLKDPITMFLMFTIVLLVLTMIVLSITFYKFRNRSPRIKKRYIVNKNVPMTCRPNQPAEQCEITIENCCNMNICETPCIQPSQLRGFQRTKTEEKKTLLTSMENGEDLY